MGLIRVLDNVHSGYADVLYYDEFDKNRLRYSGYVSLFRIPEARWFAYLYVDGKNQIVGNVDNGYVSRSLALNGLEKAIIDIYGLGYTDDPKESSEGLTMSLGGIPDEEEF